MPKVLKHSEQPYDGAILRALRAQAGIQSSQFAVELSAASGYKVLAPHISGYESGQRFVPDWLIESASKILSKRLKVAIDPMIFPEYTARRFTAAHAMNPREARKFIEYNVKFMDQRKRLIAAGTRAA